MCFAHAPCRARPRARARSHGDLAAYLCFCRARICSGGRICSGNRTRNGDLFLVVGRGGRHTATTAHLLRLRQARNKLVFGDILVATVRQVLDLPAVGAIPIFPVVLHYSDAPNDDTNRRETMNNWLLHKPGIS